MVIVVFGFTSPLKAQTAEQLRTYIQTEKTEIANKAPLVSFLYPGVIIETSIWQLGGLSLLHVYKRLISKELDGDCAFSPSCSAFSAQAILDKGLLRGVLLTADRLCRCHAHAARDYSHYLEDFKTEKVNDPATAY